MEMHDLLRDGSLSKENFRNVWRAFLSGCARPLGRLRRGFLWGGLFRGLGVTGRVFRSGVGEVIFPYALIWALSLHVLFPGLAVLTFELWPADLRVNAAQGQVAPVLFQNHALAPFNGSRLQPRTDLPKCLLCLFPPACLFQPTRNIGFPSGPVKKAPFRIFYHPHLQSRRLLVRKLLEGLRGRLVPALLLLDLSKRPKGSRDVEAGVPRRASARVNPVGHHVDVGRVRVFVRHDPGLVLLQAQIR